MAAFTLLDAGLYYSAVAPALDDVYSLAEPARLVRASADHVAIYTYRTSAYSMEYYAERPIREAQTAAEAAALLSGAAPVVLLTRTRQLDAIRHLMTSPWNVWWDGRRARVLLSNRGAPVAALRLAHE